jgi:hypothetical protein
MAVLLFSSQTEQAHVAHVVPPPTSNGCEINRPPTRCQVDGTSKWGGLESEPLAPQLINAQHIPNTNINRSGKVVRSGPITWSAKE